MKINLDRKYFMFQEAIEELKRKGSHDDLFKERNKKGDDMMQLYIELTDENKRSAIEAFEIVLDTLTYNHKCYYKQLIRKMEKVLEGR